MLLSLLLFHYKREKRGEMGNWWRKLFRNMVSVLYKNKSDEISVLLSSVHFYDALEWFSMNCDVTSDLLTTPALHFNLPLSLVPLVSPLCFVFLIIFTSLSPPFLVYPSFVFCLPFVCLPATLIALLPVCLFCWGLRLFSHEATSPLDRDICRLQCW